MVAYFSEPQVAQVGARTLRAKWARGAMLRRGKALPCLPSHHMLATENKIDILVPSVYTQSRWQDRCLGRVSHCLQLPQAAQVGARNEEVGTNPTRRRRALARRSCLHARCQPAVERSWRLGSVHCRKLPSRDIMLLTADNSTGCI